METVARKRVVIGGTFACDDALAVPLQHLLKNAVWDVNADLHWLQYGSLVNFDEWSRGVFDAAYPADLVVLLVRLSDLNAAHPELKIAARDNNNSSEPRAELIEQFICDLERYDASTTKMSAAPLVVLICPCAPATAMKFESFETQMQRRINVMQKVQSWSSDQLLTMFRQHYNLAFYDAVNDKRQHSPYTQAMLNVLALSLCRQISRLFRSPSSRKKVIVLDCDNTLWGGAVAEVGVDGIDLAPRYLALQRFVVARQQWGMLLALCSKNIHEDIAQVFEQRHEDMVLHLQEHVVASRVNWRMKSENIKALAKELSLGLDSFIFIDDNPIECDEVATALPAVTVITLGSRFDDSILDHEWVFDEGFDMNARSSAKTIEDARRTQLYKENHQRRKLRETSSTHKAFLSALGVKIVFEILDPAKEATTRSSSFMRLLQLHHRTNQFNTSTTFAKRLEEGELLAYIKSPGHTAICAHVTDRFGHYGLVSTALCQHRGDLLQIDSFLLSCRALNRGVEHAMLRKLGDVAINVGAVRLELKWEPTERNQPAHAFFSQLSDVGFIAGGTEGDSIFDLAKWQRSTLKAGCWEITVKKATEVDFLKSDESVDNNGSKQQGLVNWLRDGVHSGMQWLMSFLYPWIDKLFLPLFLTNSEGNRQSGLLRVSFRGRGSLDEFLLPALREDATVGAFACADEDCNEDDKFRRKARHQTKMALVNHLHEDTSRVVWSANRPYKDAKRHHEVDDVEALQLICQSPHCTSVIQRESRCAFQSCRNCCYRIQRLLTRSLHHANAGARESAQVELRTKFAVDVTTKEATGPDLLWCQAHKNKRRRGEMCRTVA